MLPIHKIKPLKGTTSTPVTFIGEYPSLGSRPLLGMGPYGLILISDHFVAGGLTVKKTFVTFRGRHSKEENKSVREQNDEFKHNKKIMSCVQQ